MRAVDELLGPHPVARSSLKSHHVLLGFASSMVGDHRPRPERPRCVRAQFKFAETGTGSLSHPAALSVERGQRVARNVERAFTRLARTEVAEVALAGGGARDSRSAPADHQGRVWSLDRLGLAVHV